MTSLSASNTLRKVRSRLIRTIDRVYTKIEVRNLPTVSRLSFDERVIVLEMAPALTGSEIVIYDVGAHKGKYASALAKLDNVSKVIAFEPNPAVQSQLNEVAKGSPKISVHRVAVGDMDGEATFYANESTASSSLLPMTDKHIAAFPWTASVTETKVPIRRLDDLMVAYELPRPNVIKLDVQGFEDRVIAGGENALSCATHVVMEMSLTPLYEGQLLFNDLYRRIADLHFRMVYVSGDKTDSDGRLLWVDAIFERTI